MDKPDNLMIENARVMFRNFAGREAPFNEAGSRNFVVFLEPDLAEKLKREGWKVKQLRAREEGDVPQDYLPVAVRYDNRPPKIVLISSQGRNELDHETVSILDYGDIKNWDLIINPSMWEVNGNTGIKAYLKTAFVTLNEDELELKYAEDPTTSTPSGSNETANEETLIDA